MRRVAFRCVAMAAGIGPALGIERRLDLDHPRAEPFEHRLNDVIAPDPKTLGHDLGRQMTVAEVPGEANQMLGVGAPDLRQRLRRGDHLHQPAIVEHQRVAAAQRDCAFEIEQEFKSARASHRHAPAVPVVKIEHDGIGCRFRPAMLAADLRGADAHNFSTLPSLMISITVGDTFSGAEYSRQTFICGARP